MNDDKRARIWAVIIAAVMLIGFAFGCASGTYSVTKDQIVIHRQVYGPAWIDSTFHARGATYHDDGTTATLVSLDSITDSDTTEQKGAYESAVAWLGKIGYAAVGFVLGGR